MTSRSKEEGRVAPSETEGGVKQTSKMRDVIYEWPLWDGTERRRDSNLLDLIMIGLIVIRSSIPILSIPVFFGFLNFFRFGARQNFKPCSIVWSMLQERELEKIFVSGLPKESFWGWS